MNRIEKIKVSLMEKDTENKITEENKAAFIIRSSGTFFPEKYLAENGEDTDADFSLDEYKEFIGNSVSGIYDSLVSQTGDYQIDSMGIWIDFVDGKKLESSMDIATLNSIKEYHGDINPVLEFAKMTLDVAYESPKDI
ncbi:MAG TPA: hypothetical protein PK122_00125 [Candidatus Paceibacterota bacterium]|nr:hypothetical protein [Candidatus Paceibacterota bacterium]